MSSITLINLFISPTGALDDSHSSVDDDDDFESDIDTSWLVDCSESNFIFLFG